jgi:hypothetical protein
LAAPIKEQLSQAAFFMGGGLAVIGNARSIS